MRIEDFNTAPAGVLLPGLLACCDVPSWADDVVARRPYPDVDAVAEAADAAARGLTPAEVDRALAAHPRIGERAEGATTEAAWSRGEQGSVDAGVETRRSLHHGNLAYEERFGRVFLICASGLSAEEILTALRRRLDNDDAAEAGEVADELRKIAVLRVRKLLDPSTAIDQRGS